MRCLFVPESPCAGFPSYHVLQDECPHIRACSKVPTRNGDTEAPLELFAIVDTPCGMVQGGSGACLKPRSGHLWIAGRSLVGPIRRSTEPLTLVPEVRSMKPDAVQFRDPSSGRIVDNVSLNRRPLVIPPPSTHTVGGRKTQRL